jgi:hypothetical protein
MDLGVCKKELARNKKKPYEKKTFSLVADQEIYYFEKRDKLPSFVSIHSIHSSPQTPCVCLLFHSSFFFVMQKAVTALEGMG